MVTLARSIEQRRSHRDVGGREPGGPRPGRAVGEDDPACAPGAPTSLRAFSSASASIAAIPGEADARAAVAVGATEPGDGDDT